MKVRCDKCGTRYSLDERLLKGARTAQAECRKCGAPIRVDTAQPVPEPTVQEPTVPAAAPVGDIDSQVALDRFLASICEPDVEEMPLPGPAAGRLALPLRRPRPAPHPMSAPVEEAGKLHRFAKEAAPAALPKEPARTARTTPSYTVSRSVSLDPETLADHRCVAFFPGAPELEPYRVLRTRILQAAGKKGGNTVMITSALPGEGKTLTAVNLALTFSKAYLETALLVDCDLRQQRIHELLGFESERGLGDYLTDGCPVSEIMVWPGVEKLTLISGGRTVPDSSEMLGSPAMKELVTDMRNRYPNRYIFFDVPPVLAGADALAFAPLVDHILFVVRAGATPMPEAQRALSMLPREKVIGLVLNRQRRH